MDSVDAEFSTSLARVSEFSTGEDSVDFEVFTVSAGVDSGFTTDVDIVDTKVSTISAGPDSRFLTGADSVVVEVSDFLTEFESFFSLLSKFSFLAIFDSEYI